MAVPKVAVIALVAIVAVPIMLGYALNLNEVTVTDYELSGDPVNVTPLLQNGVAYNYTRGNVFKLNTDIAIGGIQTIPKYNSITTTSSSYGLTEDVYYNQTWNNYTQTISSQYFYEEFNFDPASNSHTVAIYEDLNGVDTLVSTITDLHTFYYDGSTGIYEYTTYVGNSYTISSATSAYPKDLTKLVINTVTGSVDSVLIAADSSSNFVDLSAGFTMDLERSNLSNRINIPESKAVLFTVNLDSITDPNYQMQFTAGHTYMLVKTTVGSVVNWQLQDYSDPTNYADLYYDTNRSDNTYQFYIDIEKTSESATYKYYDQSITAFYVGGWPTVIGKANYYNSYTLNTEFRTAISSPDYAISVIAINNATNYIMPTIRIDDSLSRSFEYPIIDNQIYTPSDFRTNPATTINNITKYGVSLEFGGNTYTVTGGNIMLGTHQVSVRGLTLDSVPNSSGTGYDNRINGTVISTTADPSQIVFNGQWSASISTTAQAATTYTKTEWIAGSFAWDGMDQNFLMAGLITSLGVFIALGIYGRRSGARVLPLMLVCGGAALLFFIMI